MQQSHELSGWVVVPGGRLEEPTEAANITISIQEGVSICAAGPGAVEVVHRRIPLLVRALPVAAAPFLFAWLVSTATVTYAVETVALCIVASSALWWMDRHAARSWPRRRRPG